MNIYLVPINEGGTLYIKKISAKSEQVAQEKLYNYFFNKYEDLEGASLEDIKDELFDLGIDVGAIYDLEEFC